MPRPVPLVVLAAGLLAACAPVPLTPEEAARACEERARAAQAPTGSAAFGVSSDDGPFTSLSIGLSTDYIAGRDPYEVYRTCVVERTGAEPIRPPALLR